MGAPKGEAPAVEEDFGDIEIEPPSSAARSARPAAIAPPPAPDELSFDVEAEPPAPVPRAAPAPIELSEEPEPELALAPMHAFVPPPDKTGHQPAADGGEAALRDAISQASREVIERVVWEVVPQLAETIIRENLDRLVKSRQG